MDLKLFPMDSQHCKLEIESYGYSILDIVYVSHEKKAVSTESTAPSKNDYAPPKYGSGSNSDSSSSRNKDNQNSTFAPSNSGPPAVRPFQNGPPMRNGGPAPFQNPSNNFNRGAPQPPVNPSIRPFAAGPVPPMKPALPVASTEKFYIELTRLPNDLLRPAALEAFIHPSIPLTLSSAKTVFGPGGVHMHTIIRLDAISDYAMMMRRNGEQGIKIRQSDKKAFDTAEDGAPIPVPMFTVAPALKSSKKDDEPRRRSRWTEKSPPQKDKENPRRRTRSRSPHRKRRRSRSPKRREQHTDPTRWCIQVTNVPFRMKDEDLLETLCLATKPRRVAS
uniref:Neur_chan_LBD domain-containing protein n=1 Tax=Caenorhabditis japonica TaxID=281687 RepID=A0A8R1EEC7_CAEJA